MYNCIMMRDSDLTHWNSHIAHSVLWWFYLCFPAAFAVYMCAIYIYHKQYIYNVNYNDEYQLHIEYI